MHDSRNVQPSPPRGSVDKALDILKAFQHKPSGLGISEVSRSTNLPKTTVHRLMNTLVQNRALERSGDSYRLGPLLFDLVAGTGGSAHANLISEVITPFLAALFEQTRHTVHLAYLDGSDVAYANKLFSTRGVDSPSSIGGRAPSHCTGVGKVLLAYNPTRADSILKGELTQWTPQTITDPQILSQELATIRIEGIAYDREEIQVGLSCIAAPVFGMENKAMAALSVSSPTKSFDPALLIPPLRRVTAAASKALRLAQSRTQPIPSI